jgi:hypothetical protein
LKISKSISKDVLIELFSVDDKFKKTFIKLITLPGQLTLDFFSEEKDEYTIPTRLIFGILAIYGIFFYLLSFIPTDFIQLKLEHFFKIQRTVELLPLYFIFIIAPSMTFFLNVLLKGLSKDSELNLIFSLNIIAYLIVNILTILPYFGDCIWLLLQILLIKSFFPLISKRQKIFLILVLILSLIPFWGDLFYIIYYVQFLFLIRKKYGTNFDLKTKFILTFTIILMAIPYIGESFFYIGQYLLLSMLIVYHKNINKIIFQYLWFSLFSAFIIIVTTIIIVGYYDFGLIFYYFPWLYYLKNIIFEQF